MVDLKQAVRDKIAELGVVESSKLFGVSVGTVSNWSSGKTDPSVAAAQLVLDSTQQTVRQIEHKLIMWEGKQVMILLPVYRTLNPHTHFTLFANYAKYGPDKIGMAIKDRTVIHEARNELVHIAMQNPAVRTFIMCDDDMILPCGNPAIFNGTYRAGVKPESASFNAISRIMSHGPDKEIVGALYYGRHEFGMPQCDWGFGAEAASRSIDLRAERFSGLHPQNWVGTGFIKVERTAIEKYKGAIDAGKFPGLEPMPGRWYGYFTPLRAAVGEDVSFCHRMKLSGVQTYLDASLVCLHADGAIMFGPKNTRNQ